MKDERDRESVAKNQSISLSNSLSVMFPPFLYSTACLNFIFVCLVSTQAIFIVNYSKHLTAILDKWIVHQWQGVFPF
jgi:hypothetical protein